jgi:hypothetical protein
MKTHIEYTTGYTYMLRQLEHFVSNFYDQNRLDIFAVNNTGVAFNICNTIDFKNNYVYIEQDEPYFIVYCPDESVMAAVDERFTNYEGYTPNVLRNLTRNEYVPIIIYKSHGKIYKCPCCGNMSGTAAPQNPRNTSLFYHLSFCVNIDKIPVEN